jgi:carotenoid 1,2-hydratase
VQGSIRLRPLLQPGLAFALDRAGDHLWSPLAPRALIEVRLRQPRLAWRGTAYLDCNRGVRALEHDFAGWQWSRAELPEGMAVFYETRPRDQAPWPLSVKFGPRHVSEIPLPRSVSLPRSGWGIQRQVRSDELIGKTSLRTLVDAPFYTRSLLQTRLESQSTLTVHESLDLDRFRQRWVQYLLPFRTPRLSGSQRARPAFTDNS